jgi:hypothetical protein
MMMMMMMMMICRGCCVGLRGRLDVWLVAVLALLYASTCCHCLLYTHPHLSVASSNHLDQRDVYSMNNRVSRRWLGGHVLISSSSRSYVLLASRSGDDNKVNNYRWQSDDINSSNNNKNSITARSYVDKSGHKQIKTFRADGSRSDYRDLDKKLQSMNNSDIASFMQRASKAKHRL